MRVVKLLLLFLSLVFFTHLFAEDVTITLQNGLNSYTGCEDAWIADWYAQNTGTDDTLAMEFEQCEA